MMKIQIKKIEKRGSFVLLYFLSLAMLLTSCSQDDEVSTDNDVAVVSFSGELRSTSNLGNFWSPTDTIGLYMVDPLQSMSVPNAVLSTGNNRKYVADDNDVFNPVSGNEVIYPNNGLPVRFIAYYPYTQYITLDYRIGVSVEDQTSPSKIDILISNSYAVYSKISKMQGLTFRHALCKLSISMVAGEGITNDDLLGMTASVQGLHTTALVSFYDGSIIQTGQLKDIPLLKSGTTFSGIIIPFSQGYPNSKVVFTTASGDKYTWNIGASAFLSSGINYEYAITINKTGVSVLGNSIQPWDSTGSVTNGEA